jgi:4-amino-4-deoxy-L-arabinose transferase-like glycosyltransferase
VNAANLVSPRSNPFERLFDRVIDPARSDPALALLLCGYAAVWWLYAVISKGSQDIHVDMGEIVAWSHKVTLGTPKHPPLAAWLVRGWFSVMPAETWAYYLFAVILATIALWIAWRISARYLSPEKRVVAIVMLTFVPFFNFHAIKFNANSVLIPFWAATTWFFLRSFETRRAGWAALAGAGAGAAMLGKYWSIFLLAGLAVAALTDSRRRSYLRSPAPWLTIGVGTLLLAPHAAWVFAHDYEPFGYALKAHPATLAVSIGSVFTYLAGIPGYVAVPIIFVLLASRPDAAAIRDSLWPAEPGRRLIVVAFAAPLLLAAPVAVLLQVKIGALWTMPAMTLLPIVLLSSPLVTVSRQAAVRLLALAIAFPLLMVAVSPIVATVAHRTGVRAYAGHYRLIAGAVESAWHAQTSQPLRIVGSTYTVVNGIVFYIADQPSVFDITSSAETTGIDEGRIKREGIAIVCPERETSCMTAMKEYEVRYPAAKGAGVSLARHHFGVLDRPVKYMILIVPPESP